MRDTIILCSLAAAALALSSCESTVDAARKISRQGEIAFRQHGISVGRVDRQIRVLGSAIIRDQNGTAVVVVLRNVGHRTVVNAPIAIDIRNAAGKSVFRNNTPGLQADLAHVPLLPPGQAIDWVNDQVLPSGTPAAVIARVGAGAQAHTAVPSFPVSGLRLVDDSATGYDATGRVHNTSGLTQLHLVLFAVARRGGRIVAAGRAILTRVPPGRSAVFHAYFIGNPQGARLSVTAPPSVLAH
jgi:hypothetical protein